MHLAKQMIRQERQLAAVITVTIIILHSLSLSWNVPAVCFRVIWPWSPSTDELEKQFLQQCALMEAEGEEESLSLSRTLKCKVFTIIKDIRGHDGP